MPHPDPRTLVGVKTARWARGQGAAPQRAGRVAEAVHQLRERCTELSGKDSADVAALSSRSPATRARRSRSAVAAGPVAVRREVRGETVFSA